MNTLVSKIAAGATIGAMTFALSLATTAPAQALTPNVQQATDHFIECLELMIKDPAEHAKQCSPSNVAPVTYSLSDTNPAAPKCYWESYKENAE